jgi:polyphosphate kinase
MRSRLRKLIQQEIARAQAGTGGRIRLKVNNLTDPELIRDLYRASLDGVQIHLLVRSMFSLVPGLPGCSDRIEAKSIVDRFLEHTRIFIFGDGSEAQYLISSADLMARNLDGRLEVACPIYDEALRRELDTYFDLQWKDTVKARLLDSQLENLRSDQGPRHRSQLALYRWLRRESRSPGAGGRPSRVEAARPAA